MTQQEQIERRKEIADYVSEGHTLAEAIDKFNVSLSTVRTACAVHGVTLRSAVVQPLPAEDTFKMIAALILERGTLEYFARRFNVSRQRIHQIMKKCKAAGIPLGVGAKLGYKHEGLKP